jgi:hypothetical protein
MIDIALSIQQFYWYVMKLYQPRYNCKRLIVNLYALAA